MNLYDSFWPRYGTWLSTYTLLSPASQEVYGRHVERFLKYCDAWHIESLNHLPEQTLLKFLSLAESASWKRVRLASLQLFFRWAYEQRFCSLQPIVRYRREKIVHQPLPFAPLLPSTPEQVMCLTPRDWERLKTSFSQGDLGRGVLSVRNRSVLWLLCTTGLTAKFLRTAPFISWEEKAGRVQFQGNRRKPVEVPLEDKEAQRALEAWLQVRARLVPPGNPAPLYVTGKGQPLSQRALYNIVAQALKRADIHSPRSGPTVLRQTLLRQRLDQGVPLQQLRAEFGIRTLAQIERYRSPS